MAKEHEAAKGALSGEKHSAAGKGAAEGHLHHAHAHHGVHVERLHDGHLLVTKHHADEGFSRHHAADLDEAMDHVMEHMGGGGEAAPSEERGETYSDNEAKEEVQ